MTRWTQEQVDAHVARIGKSAAHPSEDWQPAPYIEPPPLKLAPVEIPEADVLSSVLTLLRIHRAVAWANRMNSGAGQFVYPDGSRSQFMRFGFKGMSDIFAQLNDGRFCAIECKRVGENTTDEQEQFLELVRAHNGVAFVARNIDDVIKVLGPA